MKRWRKIFQANGNEKKAEVGKTHIRKIDFKTKFITKDKEGRSILIKVSIQEEAITLVNIDIPNIGTPKYIKQK